MKGVKHWEELHMERLALGRSYALGRVTHLEELRIRRSTHWKKGGVTHWE